MGFLDMGVMIPFYWILGGIVGIFIPVALLVRDFSLNKKYCPERKIIIKARKDGFPIIELIDIGSGNAVWELGVKGNANDIKFNSQFSGIRIDPVLTSVGCEPKRFQGGLDVYSYAFENYLPQTHRNHLAYKAIIDYFHTNAKDLEFLTDIEFVSLISTPQTHLGHDILIYISKYFKNDVYIDAVDGVKKSRIVRQVQSIDNRKFIEIEDAASPDGKSKIPNPQYGQPVTSIEEVHVADLATRIEEIKCDIATLPIAFGWFAGTEAFKNNAYGYAAQDLEMLLIIHDKLQLADTLKKINIMTYAVAALIVMIGGMVTYYGLTIAAGHK